jgi:predicted nucleic acid-binding protein
MRLLVDTCIWSEVLRKKDSNKKIKRIFVDAVQNSQIEMIGPIRQEILSGIKTTQGFTTLKSHLDAFPDEKLITDDFVEAARFFNICRAKGIQGSNTDFLICAVAIRRNLTIFTVDKDFVFFSRHVPIEILFIR